MAQLRTLVILEDSGFTPGSTWQLSTVPKSSRESDALFRPPQAPSIQMMHR